MSKIDVTNFSKKIYGKIEPKIYGFKMSEIPDYVKIGDTYRSIETRLNEWKEIYGNKLKHDPTWEWIAKIDDKCYFRDFEIHKYLESKGKHRLQPNECTSVQYSKEFFKNVERQEIEDAISDIKDNYKSNTRRYTFYKLEDKHQADYHYERICDYSLRPNQKNTVDRFIEARKNGNKKLLMFAVMRFGKSFTAMQCALKMENPNAKFVLIVSGKADVREEWKKTIESHVDFSQYLFLDKTDLSKPENKNIINKTLCSSASQNRVVVFLTLQDLLGPEIKNRHRQIFGQNKVDLLIVDETHFAAWSNKTGEVIRNNGPKENLTKEETDTVEDAIDYLKKKRITADTTLHLSGTPYRLLYNNTFSKDSIIAFYQFSDIKNDQLKWLEENKDLLVNTEEDRDIPNNKKLYVWDNPYFGFPEMIRFAFHPNEAAIEKIHDLKLHGKTCEFSDFFKTKSLKKDRINQYENFEYRDIVLDFLKSIDGTKDDSNIFGFLDYDKIKQGKMCRHIVMVLPYRASCDAMEKLINSNNFKNLNNYKILNISGFNQKREYKKPSKIQEDIASFDDNDTKTLTLTVTRLMTGTTVPQWDTMIYLKDTKSPQTYDQTIYRIQSQFIKNYKTEKENDNDVIKIDMKPQTLLVDFKPERMFFLQGKSSRIHDVGSHSNEDFDDLTQISKDLEFSNIFVINKNKLEKIDAPKILETLTEYSIENGIFNEVDDIPVDLSLELNEEIYNVISKLPIYNSKDGIQISATESSSGSDLEVPPEDNEQSETDSGDNHEIDSNSQQNESVQKKEFVKKFKTLYTRILYYAFLTESNVKSLNQIINSLETMDNKRIAKNLHIDVNFLSKIRKYIATPILGEINNSIFNINRLTNDHSLSKIERAQRVMKQLSRISKYEVKTPDVLCNSVVENISDDIFKLSVKNNYKFLDIASKTGEFALALYNKMKKLNIPNEFINDSIYSIPTSDMTYEFTLKFYKILGLNSKNISRKFNSLSILDLCQNDVIDYGKIVKALTQYKNFCDIDLKEDINKGDKNMIRFNVIVGNPPYQKTGGSGGSNDAPVYQEFYNVAKALKPDVFSLIIKSAWFSTGRENLLGDFRKDVMENKHIRDMVVYSNSADVFKGGVEIEGGICYFLYDSNNKYDKCLYTFNQENTIKRDLGEFKKYNVIIQDSTIKDIVKCVLSQFDSNTKTVDSLISNDTPFGIPSNPKTSKKHPVNVYDEKSSKHDVALYYIENKIRKIGYVERKAISKHQDDINVDKVFITGGHGSSKAKPHSVIGLPEIAPKNSVCSQSYLYASFDSSVEAANFYKYLKTKFLRILVASIKITQSSPQNVYRFVPVINFKENSDIFYNNGKERNIKEIDSILIKKFNLDKYANFINDYVKDSD